MNILYIKIINLLKENNYEEFILYIIIDTKIIEFVPIVENLHFSI
jgi:hypothetical protein